MKKIIIVITFLMVLITLSACDAFDRDDFARVGDTRANGQISFTVETIYLEDDSFGDLEEDETFLAIEITVQNIGTVITREISLDDDFILANGTNYPLIDTIESTDTLEGRLEVGERKTAILIYKVPLDFEALTFTFNTPMQADGIFIYELLKNDLES
ncbi:MAG: DUF4352 domain-containing protein [Candidatus Izemoplasmataceae bacterium]